MQIAKRVMGAVLAVGCCGALAACGRSSNPTVDSSDFVSNCQKQTSNIPAGLDKTTVCRCVQQKLEAAGYGGKRVNDPSVSAAPTTLIEACFAGGTPSTTTT
jgi:hypothetical protein